MPRDFKSFNKENDKMVKEKEKLFNENKDKTKEDRILKITIFQKIPPSNHHFM